MDAFTALDELYAYVFMLCDDSFESFCSGFPYGDFAELAMRYGGKPEGTLALSVFALCCASSHFPAERFAVRAFVEFCFGVLDSESADASQAALQIMSILSASSAAVIGWLIELGICERLLLLPLSIEFSSMVYVLASCENPKIGAVIDLIPLLLSSDDEDIVNNGLYSISSLLPEHREAMEDIVIRSAESIFNLDNEGFRRVGQEFFEVLGSFEKLPTNFITPILGKMMESESSRIILKGNYIFRKQKSNWYGIVDSFLIFYLIELSRDNTYEIQKSSLMTIMLYYHFDFDYEPKITKMVIMFLEDSDLSVSCLAFLSKMIDNFGQNSDFMEDIGEIIPTVEMLCTSCVNEVCEEATKLLEKYKSMC